MRRKEPFLKPDREDMVWAWPKIECDTVDEASKPVTPVRVEKIRPGRGTSGRSTFRVLLQPGMGLEDYDSLEPTNVTERTKK